MSQITTHVLDAAAGGPAVGVAVVLEALQDGAWRAIGAGTTDADGRLAALGPDRVGNGVHRLTFDTGAWFASLARPAFYPEVQISFTVADGSHHHVPLLLSPFAYSTYRGS